MKNMWKTLQEWSGIYDSDKNPDEILTILLTFCNNALFYDSTKEHDELVDEIEDFFSISYPFTNDENETIAISFFQIGLINNANDLDKKNSKIDIKTFISDCSSTIEKIKKSNSELFLTNNNDDTRKLEIYIYTNFKQLNETYLENVEEELKNKFSYEIKLRQIDDIFVVHRNNLNKKNSVPEFEFEIDNSKNILKSPISNINSIVVNLSSKSIKKVYQKFGKNNGPLYHLNLRYYITNKNIDKDIKDTILNNSNDFWLLNNGIVVICEDYEILNNNTILMKNFSFVNGGQTTHLIGSTEMSDKNEFYIISKIIKIDSNSNKNLLAEKIATATNKQKPINQKDLIANSTIIKQIDETMRNFTPSLFLSIKRGQNIPLDLKGTKFNIRRFTIDDILQLICTYRMLEPGRTKNKKNTLFSEEIKNNLLDNFDANDIFVANVVLKSIDEIIKEYKKNKSINVEVKEMLKVGRFLILSLLGFMVKYFSFKSKIDHLFQQVENKKINEEDFFMKVLHFPNKNIRFSFIINNFNEFKNSDSFREIKEYSINVINEYLIPSWEIVKDDVTIANFSKSDKHFFSVLLKIQRKWSMYDEHWIKSDKNVYYQIIKNIFKKEI